MARSRKFPKKLGIIVGRGTPTSDNIPATLPKNGYVLPADTVAFVHGGRCYANGGVVDERYFNPGMQPSIAQFANGGFLGLLFGESNADRTRREIKEMQSGTYKGQQGSQSTNIDNQPTQLNNKGINVIKNRTDQINDTVDRAVNGYKDGGIPAMVSPGEAVLSPKSIADFGRAVLDLVRASTHNYANGGTPMSLGDQLKALEPKLREMTARNPANPIEYNPVATKPSLELAPQNPLNYDSIPMTRDVNSNLSLEKPLWEKPTASIYKNPILEQGYNFNYNRGPAPLWQQPTARVIPNEPLEATPKPSWSTPTSKIIPNEPLETPVKPTWSTPTSKIIPTEPLVPPGPKPSWSTPTSKVIPNEPLAGPMYGKEPFSIAKKEPFSIAKWAGRLGNVGQGAMLALTPTELGGNSLETPEAQQAFTDPNSSANYYRQQSVLNRRGRTRSDINNSVIGNYLASNPIDNAISNFMFDTSLPTGSKQETPNAPSIGKQGSIKIPVGGASDIVQNPFNVSRGTIDPNQSYINDVGINQQGPGGQYKIDANGNVTKFDANGNQVKMRGGFGIMDSPKTSGQASDAPMVRENAYGQSPYDAHLSYLNDVGDRLRFNINNMQKWFPDTTENRKKIAFYATQLKGIEDELGQNNRANLTANTALQAHTIDAYGRHQSALARLQAEQARQAANQNLAMPKYMSDLLDLKYKQDLSSPDPTVRDQAESYFKRAKGEQQPQIFDVQTDPNDITKTAKARYNNGRLEILPIAGQATEQAPSNLELVVGKRYHGANGEIATYQGVDKSGKQIWIGSNGKQL